MRLRALVPLLLAVAPLSACASYSDIGPAPGEALDRRMPIHVHEPQGGAASGAFVVLYSGDGGSSGGAKAMADEAAARGVPVVDVDSLGYFWRRRSRANAAKDLEALIARFSARWRARGVVLAGYSFGASALPGIVLELPKALQAKIRSVVLIAPRDYVEMTLRPHSWINIRLPGARPLTADLAPLGWARRVCVYGESDGLAACPRLPVGMAQVRRLSGGHTFGGDYAGVASVLAAEAGEDEEGRGRSSPLPLD